MKYLNLDARRAKIVATIGPASETPEKIKEMYDAGVNVFRLNFSHATHDEHRMRYETVRKIAAENDRPVAIFADLQGPKLRVGDFRESRVFLKKGQEFKFDMLNQLGDETRVELSHQEIFDAIKQGDSLLVDDGKLRLVVKSHTKNSAVCEVMNDGYISNHKGVNYPSGILNISALTEKDLRDLEYALSLGVDYIALSFVQRAEDLINARKIIGDRAKIIAKLEKPSIVENLDKIIEASDAIMVARGDLGVELPAEDVPALQKRIIAQCRKSAKPVIVATQILESMISSPVPTRAEVSDVANAIYDGADALMLSAETASGQYPIEAIKIMSKIIQKIEHEELYWKEQKAKSPHNLQDGEIYSVGTAISSSVAEIAEKIGAKVIVSLTRTGASSLRVARQRNKIPHICAVADKKSYRTLSLVWGVIPIYTDAESGGFHSLALLDKLKENKLIKEGELVVVISGINPITNKLFEKAGLTNNITVLQA